MQKLLDKFNNSLKTKILFFTLIGLFVLFSIFIFSFRYFVSYSFIESKFSELTGLKIEFINPKTTLDYKFNLKTISQEINILDKNKTTNFVSIKNAHLNLKPIGFLFNKAYIKNLSADDIQINIKRNKAGDIDLIDNLNKDIFNLQPQKITLTRLDSKIKNINLNIEDNYIKQAKTNFNLQNTAINISKRKKSFEFKQEGTIETTFSNSKTTSNTSINIKTKYPINNIALEKSDYDISLNDINLFLFSDLARNYISEDIDYLNGSFDINLKTENKTQKLSLEISNPTIKSKDNKTISPFKEEKIVLNSLFEIDRNKVQINSGDIHSKGLSSSFNGVIENYLTKKPNINLNLSTNKTQINNLIHFIPDNAIFYRPKGIPTLKKSNFHGLASGKMNIKTFPLNIEGNIKVENVHIPNYPKPYKQNDVNVTFLKDKLRIHTRVYTPDNEHVIVDGISNLDDSLYGEYSVKSTSKVDLAFAQLYLVPIQQIIGFNIGPVPIMNIAGYGNIDIDTKGTLSDAQIYGNFEAYNASATLDGLDAKLKDGKCKLVFDDRNLIFKEISGNLDGAKFLLTGIGNTKGEVDLNAKLLNAKASSVIKTFNNSLISKPYATLTKQIKSSNGNIEADINLKGIISDYENKEFLTTLAPSGTIKLNNTQLALNNDLKVDNITGNLNFGNIQTGDFDFNINNSKFSAKFNSNDNLDKISKGNDFKIQSEVSSPKISFKDVITTLNNSQILQKNIHKLTSEIKDIDFYTKLSLKSQGVISLNKIDLKTFKHNGYLIGLNDGTIQNTKFNKGIIKFINNRINIDDLDIDYKQGKIKANGNLFNISSLKPIGDLSILLKDIQIENLNNIIPNIKTAQGIIKTGVINFKNNDIKINALSLDYATTPLFLNATIKDIYKSKNLFANFSTIINEQTTDSLINPYLITPINVIGEIPIKGSFEGNLNNYSIDFSTILPKDSDISFSGANLGDTNLKRELQGKISVVGNSAKIHNFKLIKYISNLNNRINPIIVLKANGLINQQNQLISYDNFKISTNTPVNVRVLNMLFKKSILKRGNFDCNITLNGDVKLPKVNGKIDLYDLDVPLYDAEINNIKMNISDSFIDSVVLAKNKQSDIKIRLHALNKLTTPYIIKDVIVSSNKLDINNLISSIKPNDTKNDILTKPMFTLKPNDLIIEKGSFEFKEVNYNDIQAQNLLGKINYKDSKINISDMLFDIAQGNVSAQGEYDISSTNLKLSANMLDCDSNTLAKNFLALPNQIFGKMNGSIILSANNLNTPDGIKSLKSDIDFSINNGKMPKLGSLEYLLRAGNLFKNGILGLSLNNIIEVLTPYKTGEFEKISGNLTVSNAEIEKLNILSQGKNLSLYLDGYYSILDNFADIKIYGKLSQNISNALGALGNASINQVISVISNSKKDKNKADIELQENLDKIPSIETQNPEPRYFKAKVLGDINKDNYIKSFDWI